MTDIVRLVHKKTPYDTALDLSAIFTEFTPRRPEWSQPLVTAFGGTGRSEEGKLRFLCADARLTREHLHALVLELAAGGYLTEFFVDDAAIDLLGWGAIAQACREYLNTERRLRVAAEQRSRFRPIDELLIRQKSR